MNKTNAMNGGTISCMLVFLIAVALLFDLMNGTHDAANAIGKGPISPDLVDNAVIFGALAEPFPGTSSRGGVASHRHPPTLWWAAAQERA